VPLCLCASVPLCLCASVPLCLCASVPLCLCAFVPIFLNRPSSYFRIIRFPMHFMSLKFVSLGESM
jgi:hypothetical protein